jgi:muramidase (phage lysozyme)
MAIGDVQLGSQVIQPIEPRATPEAFGAGVAVALQGLAQEGQQLGLNISSVNAYLAQKRKAQAALDADTAMAKWAGEQDRKLEASAHGAAPGARGYTDASYDSMRKSGEEFLKGIDPTLQDEYRARVETFVQNRTTSAFKFEQQSGDQQFISQINELVTEAQTTIYNSPDEFDDAFSYIKDAIGKTTLPPTQKEALEQQAFNSLASVDFQRRAERAATGVAPVGPTDGKDVVAPGLPGYARGALNAIASVESPDYATINGGGKFTDFSDHPRVRVYLPNGDFSTAAGRYQIIAPTWDTAKRALGLQGFDAVSQDRAAWWTAKNDYRAATGRSLDAVLSGNDPAAIVEAKHILEPTWTGLKGMPDSQWLAMVHGGMQAGGTGDAAMPNLWGDPRYAGLPFDTKLQLQNAALQQIEQAQIADQRARAQAEDQAYNALVEGVGSGTVSEPMVELAIQNGDLTEAGKISAVRNMVKDQREIRESLEKTLTQIQNPSHVFTTEKEDLDALDVLYDKGGLQASVGAMDPQGPQALNNLVRRTGVIPPKMALQLEQMSAGTPQQQGYALDIAASLSEAYPGAFSTAASDELEARASFWRTSRQYSTDEAQALQQYADWRSPEKAAMRARYEDEADKILNGGDAKYPGKSPQDALNLFMSSTFGYIVGAVTGTNPQIPSTGAEQALLFNDYSALFKQYYPLMQGDENKTNEMVSKLLHRVWGVNTVDGSNKLMKYAPNAVGSGIPLVDGSLQWVDTQIRDAVGMTSSDRYELVSDGQTAAGFAQGKPSWKVMRLDDLGQLYAVPDPADPLSPLRVRPTITPEMKADIGDKVKIDGLSEQLMNTQDPAEQQRLIRDIGTLDRETLQGPRADVQRRIDAFNAAEAKLRKTRDAVGGNSAMYELFNRDISNIQRERAALEALLSAPTKQGAQ